LKEISIRTLAAWAPLEMFLKFGELYSLGLAHTGRGQELFKMVMPFHG
jgi:hypothetical protein